MTQARKSVQAPVRRKAAAVVQQMGGPLLPGEFRPLAPVPAASEPSDPPPLTEAECIRCLVKHYRWTHLGDNRLIRWNPHGRAIAAEVEALGNA